MALRSRCEYYWESSLAGDRVAFEPPVRLLQLGVGIGLTSDGSDNRKIS